MKSISKLNNGEIVALSAVEIISIPHYSTIDEDSNIEIIIQKYQFDIQSMLNEAYQLYKAKSINIKNTVDVSFELIWLSNKIENQTFNAKIRLFIIVRAISSNVDIAEKNVDEFLSIFKSTYSNQKYELMLIEYEQIKQQVKNTDDSNINAIVKEENLENLQNQILPYCYSFDRIPKNNSDFSRLIKTFIRYPNCAISFQLIPTHYTNNEIAQIDKITQMLGTLYNGIMDHNVGNVSFTLAEKYLETYKYYSKNKSAALYNFNILVYGDNEAASAISSSLLGQLSLGIESQSKLKIVKLDKGEVNKDNNFYPLPWAINEILISKNRNSQIWSSGYITKDFYRYPYIATAEELQDLFRLPIGSYSVNSGFIVNESEQNNKTYYNDIINSGDITIGELKSNKGNVLGISLKDIAKHMLVVGTPGSGKTTFSVGLLDRLWKNHNIPFLVIEPAKNEYRAMIQSIPDLQVFTPGKNFISPFVFNPFVPPKKVKLETYKSTLKTAFAAGVSMSSPLDKIFEEAVNNCYSDFRWLDTYTSDDKGKIFNISDFIKCFQQTFDEIGYTGDAKNIGRAGMVRLKGLINLFDNYYSVPIEDILSKPTVIELSAIENADEKALIIALLLLSILAYVNANYVGEGGLQNVILLEEAHVLLDASSNVNQDSNPSAIAQGLVKRMLAEIRSYGVGIIIADQSPRKVGTDVVALTDIKAVFRLVENDDKQIIANSTGMNETKENKLAKLKPGEAFFFFNKLVEPEEIITPNYRLDNNISISLSDDGIAALSTYWKRKEEFLKPYPECNLINYCPKTCDYYQRVLAKDISRRIFVKYIKVNATDFSVVENVFKQISKLIKYELNDEIFTPQLLSCVKVHLWRKIKYETKISVPEILIRNSLKK